MIVEPKQLIGAWRRFGPIGPVYEVVAEGAAPESMRIRVLESGEELDYKLADILDDPRER